jgi:hypothetical protein
MKNIIRKILKEEKDKDWDFMDDIKLPFPNVNHEHDYIGVWDRLRYVLHENCVNVSYGNVLSSDDDATIDIELTIIGDPEFDEVRIFMEPRHDGEFYYWQVGGFLHGALEWSQNDTYPIGSYKDVMEPIYRVIKTLNIC